MAIVGPYHFGDTRAQRVFIVQMPGATDDLSKLPSVVGEGIILSVDSILLKKAMSPSADVKGKRYLFAIKGSNIANGVVRIDVDDGLQEFESDVSGSPIRFVTYGGKSASEIIDEAVKNGDGVKKVRGGNAALGSMLKMELGYSDTCAIDEEIDQAFAALDKFL